LSTPLEDKLKKASGEWVRRARSNLALAKQPKLDEVVWEDLCFEAQQAAEKAIKAILVLQGIDFPKTHQIASLLGLLDQSGLKVPEELWKADNLTDYAVEARYPDRVMPVTEDEYHQAIAVAEKVVQWAEGIISSANK
jgi:HEPN domain-containing protein